MCELGGSAVVRIMLLDTGHILPIDVVPILRLDIAHILLLNIGPFRNFPFLKRLPKRYDSVFLIIFI